MNSFFGLGILFLGNFLGLNIIGCGLCLLCVGLLLGVELFWMDFLFCFDMMVGNMNFGSGCKGCIKFNLCCRGEIFCF